jgi:hypothetical protein
LSSNCIAGHDRAGFLISRMFLQNTGLRQMVSFDAQL